MLYFAFILWHTIRLRPRVVMAFLRRPGVYAILLKALLPWRRTRVLVSDDTIPSRSLELDTRGRPARRLLASLLIRVSYPRADRIIVPSERARRDLVSRFGVPARIVEVTRDWTLPQAAAPSAAEYEIVYVGRIDREKDLERLVELLGDPVACRVLGRAAAARVRERHGRRNLERFVRLLSGPAEDLRSR